MKSILLFVVISLFACQSKKQTRIEIAMENNDTALAKKLAQQELDKTRASITDPAFADIMDASLLIQSLQFELDKADSLKHTNKFSTDFILNNQNGKRLYDLTRKNYIRALEITSNANDVIYFTTEMALTQKEWLELKFANKKAYEVIIALLVLQRDIALISAIESKADNEGMRQELQQSYQQSIDDIKKSYQK